MRLDAEVKKITARFSTTTNTILLLNNRIETYKELVAKYKTIEANQSDQIKLYSDMSSGMRKQLRRAEIRGYLGGAVGIALVLLSVWLVHK